LPLHHQLQQRRGRRFAQRHVQRRQPHKAQRPQRPRRGALPGDSNTRPILPVAATRRRYNWRAATRLIVAEPIPLPRSAVGSSAAAPPVAGAVVVLPAPAWRRQRLLLRGPDMVIRAALAAGKLTRSTSC
jgi:hypothetical protein